MNTLEGWAADGTIVVYPEPIERDYKNTLVYKRLKSGDLVEAGVARWDIRSDNGVLLDTFKPPGYT